MLTFIANMSSPTIKIENATISQHKKVVLKQVLLEISEGAFVYFIGRTGSGKSSLIRTLYAAMPLTAGEIHICDTALSKLKKRHIHKLRRKLGIVFQDFKLLNDRSIYDNLEFILKSTGINDKKEINKKIQRVLKLVGINSSLDKFPNQLSGGEQQRVAIARSVLNNPELIIADEPTGNLDPETSLEIIELFQRLNKIGTSMIIATHDYNLILKLKGKVFKCEDGKFFEVKRK